MELERHALDLIVLGRLGMLLVTLSLIDLAICTFRARVRATHERNSTRT
jgi:hypothetical protein